MENDMTTAIRVEHADARNKYNTTIEVWEATATSATFVKVKDIILDTPAEQVLLHTSATKYYVIKETEKPVK
jgi:hypothetical protein